MFDALWKNISVATFSDAKGYGIIEDAAIGIKNGKITFVGPAFDLPDLALDSRAIHDGKGRWALPGFIDCHTHLIYGGNRADEFEKRLQGESYETIARGGGGILATVRATRQENEDVLYQSALARFTLLFQQGVTAVEIKSGYGLDLDTEQKMLRVATRLRDDLELPIQRTFLGAHAVPPEFKDRADDYIDHLCRNVLPALATQKLVDAVDAFCENIAFSADQVRRIFDVAKDLSLPVKIHAERLSNQHAAALAAEYKALSADHLEYLDENGVKNMAQAGVTAVLLPGAFYYLREKKMPPIELLREHRVPIALATDHNPGTSPILSILTILNMGAVLFGLTPEESLRGVTINAARAMGMEQERGSLTIGKAADISFWDITHPRDLVYRLGGSPCTGVYVNGNYIFFRDEG